MASVDRREKVMPIHDWRRVDAGIFHAFHVQWIAELNKALNNGLLPPGYYSLPEQHATSAIPDILTLHASPAATKAGASPPPATGGLALAEAPPKVQRQQTVGAVARTRRRTLAIRHVSEHRLVALVEILSPANKDRPRSVADFAGKIVAALGFGIHALVIDLLPPGPNDCAGIHGAIWQRLEKTEESYDLPEDDPLTLASYRASDPVEIYLEHPPLSAELPEMPLFLRPDRYINVPLEPSYQEAFRTMPEFWRNVLEGGQESAQVN
jgi:hypothetical protein